MAAEIEFKTGRTLPHDQIISLYNSVNWSAYTAGEAGLRLKEAINNSTYVVSAWSGQQLVGMARCLSDDVSIFYLQDILIRPEFQRQGFGRKLLNHCLHRFEHVRMKVLLTDDEERQVRFYESMGFQNTSGLSTTKLNTYVSIAGKKLE